MVDPLAPLRQRVLAAAQALFGDEGAAAEPALHRSAHADYQADIALALARKLKRNPKEVGAALAAALPADDVIAQADVSGPGFINLTLQPGILAAELGRMLVDDRLGSPPVAAPETVVVDYSSPNLAKEMHVGNMRTTIIGDALARLLEFQGHRVLRQNHVGDWGTPFGMLLEQLLDARAAGGEASVRELVGFYRDARAKFDADPAFAERARKRVVLLQGGDAETLALWRRLMDISVEYFDRAVPAAGRDLAPGARRGREPVQRRSAAGGGQDLVQPGPGARKRRRDVRVPARLRRPRGRADGRSSCASRTAATATRPPIWRPCATGWASWAPRG